MQPYKDRADYLLPEKRAVSSYSASSGQESPVLPVARPNLLATTTKLSGQNFSSYVFSAAILSRSKVPCRQKVWSDSRPPPHPWLSSHRPAQLLPSKRSEEY